MIIWVIFILQALILICIGFKRGFLKSGISFVVKIVNVIISFIVARIVVNLLAENAGKNILDVIGNEYHSDLNNLEYVQLFSEFLMSIFISIIVFYITYFLLFIINTIIKNIIIYRKFEDVYIENDKKSINPIWNKIGIITVSVISCCLTFFVLLTPIGMVYNISKDILKIDYKEDFPFVSEVFFNKLTEMSENNQENDVETSKELKNTLKVTLAISDLKSYENSTDIIKESFPKTYFLPSVINEMGSAGAKKWKKGEEFLTVKFDIPEGREKKLYLSSLDILENWNKESVIQDVCTMIDVYELLNDYGIDKIKENDGLLEVLSNEDFTEELFVSLYKNDDFANLVPIIVEYGLGTAFDYIEVDLSEEYTSKVDIKKLSEDDIRKEAKIVSGVIKTILEIKQTNEKLENSKMDLENIQKIINEFSKLKDSQILGDIANEFLVQFKNSVFN